MATKKAATSVAQQAVNAVQMQNLAGYDPAQAALNNMGNSPIPSGPYFNPVSTPIGQLTTDQSVAASGGGGGGSAQSAQDAYYAWLKEEQQREKAEQLRQQQAAAISSIKAQFAAMGLSSLSGKIEEYIKAGYDSNTAYLLLTQTDEYKNRFPAMAALAAKGRAISELDYIAYERNAAQLEQMYGLPSGMLSSRVTDLLTNEVSAAELGDRVQMASANSVMAPQDVKDVMRDYYGIDAGGLTAYYLDPDIALPMLQKQAASALIGTEARRQGLNVDLMTSEGLQALGVSQDTARQGFGSVRRAQGFESGYGETATQGELIGGVFGNQDLLAKINRIAGSRSARFQQGGGYATDRSGYAGLGGANR